ncbi:MAG: TspO/MBR family protein, partial [bacterium]
NRWFLMAFYLLVELTITAYTPVTCKLRSLKAGTIIGGTGFFLGCLLVLLVFPVSSWAGILLLPYLIWSPIGTYVTWEMSHLNPRDV